MNKKDALILRCLSIIDSLPEAALEEAVNELQDIAQFYENRSNLPILPTVSTKTIKGKLGKVQVRPPIKLDS